MELQLIDAFGYVDKNVAILNNDEYTQSAGSFIMVKNFKTSSEKSSQNMLK